MPIDFRFDDLDLREEPVSASDARFEPAALSDNPQCCSKGTLTE